MARSLDNSDTTSSEKVPDDFLTSFLGDKIRKRRLELGLSMEKVAQIAQVSRGMLGLIETGKTTPSIAILWKLSKALRTQVAEFLPDVSMHSPKIFRKEESKLLTLHKERLSARVLYRDSENHLEFLEVELSQGSFPLPIWFQKQKSQTVSLVNGEIGLVFGGKKNLLSPGDTAVFLAQELQEIFNPSSSKALLFWISSSVNL
ncbi:helix-turn-helix transcriptional regulator [Leptospira stimsonii]|uniref:XRE family transcriptional regulator n=1 Tax=Leptospira stimsonii TaxID=2202203 RepID=A0A8B3CPT1_9LEPT|nr:helix-turn-helix transcriptional regulator [Leptospira stimsonii]RHX84547.1 XRE family transcriptional regulator [Leptospira stimsonii]